MIKLLYSIDEGYIPVVVCDICGRRIKDGLMAAAVYQIWDLADGDMADVLHAHLGDCQAEAETRLGGQVGWDHLSRHLLLMLAPIAGIDIDKIREVDQLNSILMFGRADAIEKK